MKLFPTLSVALVGLFAAASLTCQDGGAGIPACEDMKTTASGLQWGILKAGGDGASPADGDTVEVHYTGWLTDGTKFDSSRDRGAPTKFGVNQVIPGWTEGLKLMKPGMRCKFVIPGDIAYGAAGRPPKIPSNATLVFDVELLKVIAMPKFRKGNRDAQTKLDNGVAYEVLKPGTGAAIADGKSLQLRYALWSNTGRLFLCTEQQGDKIVGPLGGLSCRAGDVSFLMDAVKGAKVGQVVRCEVPKSVWGRAGTDTVWEFELLKQVDLPKFRALDKDKVVTTQSGLKYEVIKMGEGDAPKVSDTVAALYTGWLTDGTMFDSAHARGEPTEFPLRGVIKGWTEGLQLMKPGSVFLFEIPSELGYGAREVGKIKANSTLIFLVELVKVK